MRKALLMIVLMLFFVSIGYGRDLTHLSAAPDQITPGEIADFIKQADLTAQESLDCARLKALTVKGEKIFQKGRILPQGYKDKFINRYVGSRGEGAETIYLYYFLNNTFEGKSELFDKYLVRVTLEFDSSGQVVDFYWDAPMLLADKVVDQEQLEIFLRYVRQKSFHDMRNKGYEIFQKGRILSKEYEDLFKPYFKREESGITRYEFYSYVDSTPRAASIYLDVNAQDASIAGFTGIEAW